MKYIIVDPDMQNVIELKNILDGYENLAFRGSFTTLEEAENSICVETPDVVFIRIGKVELNAFKLTQTIREQNPLSKVILFSNHDNYAIEAFEYEADGFLLEPFNLNKVMALLQK